MDSIDLAEEICQEIKKFRDWVQAEGELIARKKESGDESYIPEEMYYEAKYTGDSIHIEQLLVDLYKNSLKDNFFFYDCPLQVYKLHYQSRLNDYLEEYIDANELDFIQDELTDLEKTFENRWLFDKINYYSFTRDNKSFKQTLEKKKKLLKKKEEKIENYQPPFQSNVNTEIMNSSNFSNYIAETILKFQEFSSKEGELLAQKKDSMFSDIPPEEKEALSKRNEEFEIKLIADQKKIGELLKQLYYKSAEDNLYWFDCPLQVYSENLEANFKKYKKEFLDDNIEDFLKDEVSRISNYHKNQFLNCKNRLVNYSSFMQNGDKIFEKSRGKKLKFLNEKLKENNIQIADFNSYKIRGETTLVPKYDYKEPKAENSLPISPKSNLVSKEQKTEKQLTSNQIVLLLDKIGFFTYPKIENTSKVKQAEVISKITGLNAKNIKTKIQNLEKSPKDLGAQHQKDIDKIDNILDNLE